VCMCVRVQVVCVCELCVYVCASCVGMCVRVCVLHKHNCLMPYLPFSGYSCVISIFTW